MQKEKTETISNSLGLKSLVLSLKSHYFVDNPVKSLLNLEVSNPESRYSQTNCYVSIRLSCCGFSINELVDTMQRRHLTIFWLMKNLTNRPQEKLVKLQQEFLILIGTTTPLIVMD